MLIFILIDVQNLQNEKGSYDQVHFFSDSQHLIKDSSLAKFPISPQGRISHSLLMLFAKPCLLDAINAIKEPFKNENIFEILRYKLPAEQFPRKDIRYTRNKIHMLVISRNIIERSEIWRRAKID